MRLAASDESTAFFNQKIRASGDSGSVLRSTGVNRWEAPLNFAGDDRSVESAGRVYTLDVMFGFYIND
jgi:hypothetical protein